MGIFIKIVTPGGVAAKDGRVKEGDQIIEVNGQSLVGVTQTHAATVLRSALGTVSFLLGREKVVKQQQANHQQEPVQFEESQTTVSPESSALEEEGNGFDFSPDSSAFEIGGGEGRVDGDLVSGGEEKQVDELESGFIENEEISSTEERGIMCERGQQSMAVIEEEHKPLVSQEENVKVDEVLVLKDETENTEEAVKSNPVPEKEESGHTSEHEETSGRQELSMAEVHDLDDGAGIHQEAGGDPPEAAHTEGGGVQGQVGGLVNQDGLFSMWRGHEERRGCV